MIKLNFKVLGEGQPIIFLHGLFGMLDNWQTFGKQLADKGYMAYLIDQRDHGKSPHTEDFNYDLLAEDLHQFMVSEWLFSAVIVGHSMGGKTAMNFAAKYPDMASKLILVDIAPKAYQRGHDEIFDAINSLDLQNEKERSALYDKLKSKLHDEGVIQFLLKNITRLKEGGFELKMNLPLLQEKYENIIAPLILPDLIGLPTLVVKGANSNYINDQDVVQFKKHFRPCTFVEVADAGHWVNADQPEALLDIMLQFLEE